MHRIACPDCGKTYRVKDLNGAKTRCRECDAEFRIPTRRRQEGRSEYLDEVGGSILDVSAAALKVPARVWEFFLAKPLIAWSITIGAIFVSLQIALNPAGRPPAREIQRNKLIAHTVLQSSEFGAYKASFDVRVDLVDGRLPTEAELVAISNRLKESAGTRERTFVAFFLPGMILDTGAFATAHHNPRCQFRLLRHNVPEKYASFLPEN